MQLNNGDWINFNRRILLHNSSYLFLLFYKFSIAHIAFNIYGFDKVDAYSVYSS